MRSSILILLFLSTMQEPWLMLNSATPNIGKNKKTRLISQTGFLVNKR
jgi:hypothetical protein